MGEAWELSRKSGALPDMREHKEKKTAFTTNTVNNDISQNFNQEYMNTTLVTISTLLYFELLIQLNVSNSNLYNSNSWIIRSFYGSFDP